jgi:hypothetical protein
VGFPEVLSAAFLIRGVPLYLEDSSVTLVYRYLLTDEVLDNMSTIRNSLTDTVWLNLPSEALMKKALTDELLGEPAGSFPINTLRVHHSLQPYAHGARPATLYLYIMSGTVGGGWGQVLWMKPDFEAVLTNFK